MFYIYLFRCYQTLVTHTLERDICCSMPKMLKEQSDIKYRINISPTDGEKKKNRQKEFHEFTHKYEKCG